MVKPDVKRAKWRKRLIIVFLLLVVAGVCGCRTFSFYSQAIKGQYQIFANQEPIDELIRASNTAPKLKTKLQYVQEMRGFAETALKLPVNGHYKKYVDLHRPFVVWNVEAAKEFTMEPKTWWYPMVGSLEYRGYFSEKAARKYGASLERKGYDVYIGGVSAYSTLGWFKDPVLNTFLFQPEADLVETVFHELAHQRVFAAGDTDFNEAFATTVGQEGARRWFKAAGNGKALADYLVTLRRNDEFVHLVMRGRSRLEALYGDERTEAGKVKAGRHPPKLPVEELRKAKRKIFDDLRAEYAAARKRWGGSDYYDPWFSRELNNAQLNSIAAYYDLVPGFEQLLVLQKGDLEEFYAAAERLAHKAKDERHQWLRTLAASGGSAQTNGTPAHVQPQ